MAKAQPAPKYTWSQITPATGSAPPPRTNHALIFAPDSNTLILFGGRGNNGTLNDIWSLSLDERIWRDLTPASGRAPAPRLTPTAIYDPEKNRLVTYSGQGAGFFNDTWAFDLAANTWQEITQASPRPLERYGTVLAYDSKRHGALTFAGFTSEEGRFDDTWNLALGEEAWQDVSPAGARPGKRCLHSGTYDAERDRFIIYAGQRNGPLDDLWAFDVATKTWNELTPEKRPAARMFTSIVYSPDQQNLVVFGGRGTQKFNDLWIFEPDSQNFEAQNPSGELPAAREGHAAVWIPKVGMLIFGGSSDSDLQNDLWLLSAQQ